MFGKKAARIAELEAALARTEEAVERKEQARIELRLEVNALTEQANKQRRRNSELKDYAHNHNSALARSALSLLQGCPQFRGSSDPIAAPAYSWTDVEQGMRRIAAELEA